MDVNFDLIDLIFGVIAALISGVFYLTKQISAYRKATKNLGTIITGEWYSAELDFKQEALENAYMKVAIKRKRLGNQITIRTISQVNKNKIRYQTSWMVNSKAMPDSTLIGEFIGTNEHSVGYGTVFLRFIGNGRAVGYWVGYSGKISGQPMYGYWILSRDEDDLKQISEFALSKFQYLNVKYLVEHLNKKVFPKDYIMTSNHRDNPASRLHKSTD